MLQVADVDGFDAELQKFDVTVMAGPVSMDFLHDTVRLVPPEPQILEQVVQSVVLH